MDSEPNSVDIAAREPTPDLLANELRNSRTTLNLSIIELSRITGISKTVLHGYERGRTKPGARELGLLSRALKISPNRLILGSDEFSTAQSKFTSLYRKIRLSNKASSVITTLLLMPAISMLDEDDVQAIATLTASLLKAKAPEGYSQLQVLIEETVGVLDELLELDGSVSIENADELRAYQDKLVAQFTSKII